MAAYQREPTYSFCQNIDELLDSISTFAEARDFYRAIVGNAPKYFVHLKIKDRHIFGLSKFCAFQSITVGNYLKSLRRRVNGANTQKHIAWLTGKTWLSYEDAAPKIRHAFKHWIHEFFPSYKLENASFITLTDRLPPGRIKQTVPMTPDELVEQLEYQQKLGNTGEWIAFAFEQERIKKAGVVKDVFNTNIRAGFDISSHTKTEDRFIEVKSSTEQNRPFFLTSNEYNVLKDLGQSAFIYLVIVDDIDQKMGQVYKIIQDPIKTLNESYFEPVLYKVTQ